MVNITIIKRGLLFIMMIVKARAKINLSLDIKGVREDGYHQILTVMQPLELFDLLEISRTERELRVDCEDPQVPSGPGNIVYNAGKILQEKYLCNYGALIKIKKYIPVAAGLGGGSADAAATISALNQLWQINAGKEELYKVAEMVGSDVPFCLLGQTALAGGRGEELTPLPSFDGFGVVLVKPPFGVSTAKVYSLYDELPAPPGSRPDTVNILRAVENKDFYILCKLMANVLEQVTINLHPEIRDIKEELVAAGAAGALMSGSGPTVFGLCKDYESAIEVASRVKAPGCRVIATRTI